MKLLLCVLSVLIVLGGVSTSQAADLAAGKQKALLVCSDCHGLNGVSVVENFPNLAGQKEMYLAKQLKAFRAGTRKNNEMKFIVKLLTDEDIANLAAYFSKLPCCKPEYR
jgi:cytochrome c553